MRPAFIRNGHLTTLHNSDLHRMNSMRGKPQLVSPSMSERTEVDLHRVMMGGFTRWCCVMRSGFPRCMS